VPVIGKPFSSAPAGDLENLDIKSIYPSQSATITNIKGGTIE